MEAAYFQTYLLAQAIEKVGSTDTDALIFEGLPGQEFQAPQGKVKIDEKNHHTWLWARIGKANEDGQFDVVWKSEDWIRPDPWVDLLYPDKDCDFTDPQVLERLKLRGGRPLRDDRPLVGWARARGAPGEPKAGNWCPSGGTKGTAARARAMWQAIITQFLIGFSVVAILIIAALGLAIIFGVAGVINMAHGELIMVGAYVAAVVGQLGGNTFLAIPAAFIVVGLIGLVDRAQHHPVDLRSPARDAARDLGRRDRPAGRRQADLRVRALLRRRAQGPGRWFPRDRPAAVSLLPDVPDRARHRS